MQISVICDVGSMDGGDALVFRDSVPEASVYAFEPNPRNFSLMETNRVLKERNIQVGARSGSQFNALYIRSDLSFAMMFRTTACFINARMRHMLVQVLRRACPACLRRYQTIRAQAVSRKLRLP